MSKTVTDNTLQAIISHAKEYGFVFPSSEIYDGLSAHQVLSGLILDWKSFITPSRSGPDE